MKNVEADRPCTGREMMHPEKMAFASSDLQPDLHTLRGLFYKMLLIRRFEEKIVDLYPEQEMRTPVHLCIGQEAIAAGVCQALRNDDRVFSNHRCHGHYLAKGGDPMSLAAELYGKQAGCSSGKGGSMHVIDLACGVSGTTGIVGGGIPIAAGAALASRIRKDDKVSVVFFGDGAADEGAFFESMGLAALKQLPLLFVIENNFYATCSPLTHRRVSTELFRLGEPHRIPSVRVDGNDAVAVLAAAQAGIMRARTGNGPSLIEAVTCRWKGHVGPECDSAKSRRPLAELEAWKKRCPLKRLLERYLDPLPGSAQLIQSVNKEVGGIVDSAFSFAQSAPFPDPDTTFTHVW